MAKRTRLLVLVPRMNGGGAERVVSIIANNLCSRDEYQVMISTLVSKESFYKLDDKVLFKSADIKINRKSRFSRKLSLIGNFIRSVFYTWKTIQDFSPNIVFPVVEEMNYVTYLATRGLKDFSLICSERNDPWQRSFARKALLKHIFSKSDQLVCQSSAVADFYSNIPRDKKTVIPNPVDSSIYPERCTVETPGRIVAVGRLVKQKNFDLLIRAFSELANELPNARLTIYGEGSERKNLEHLISEKGMEARIELPGAQKDVLNCIKDAALFVMSSDFEGFPNALIEAIKMGIPVVSTDFATGVAREIVTEEVGCVVPCGDMGAMVEAIRSLLTDDVRRKHIRETGFHATDAFEVNLIVKQWEAMFSSLDI